MMGLHFKDEVPFHRVFTHTRVLDEEGREGMSKTKGNVVDPLDLVDAYGADALRFTLALAAGTGRDMRIRRVACGGQPQLRHQAVERGAFLHEMNGCETRADFDPAATAFTVNRWIVADVHAPPQMTKDLEDLHFNEAAGAKSIVSSGMSSATGIWS